MESRFGLTVAFLTAGVFGGSAMISRAAADAKAGVDWPQFRGIRASGIAEGFPLPAAWDVAKGQNIAWKTEVPGLGLSSPIVWGDLTCVSTSISGQKDASLKVGLFEVLAENDMTESVLSTPAISEGSLLYRTQKHVTAVRAAR